MVRNRTIIMLSRGHRSLDRHYPHGFTLIEVIISIGIIVILAGILVPALQNARQRGRITVCLSNAKSINEAMIMYLSDDGKNLPWTYIHRVSSSHDFETFPGATGFTTFSWGGMLPRSSHGTVDSQMTPVELRPFNRYVAADARGFDIVKNYVCPSDRSASNPALGAGSLEPDHFSGTPNWRAYGTSYSISWHWTHAYASRQPDMRSFTQRLMHFGSELIRTQAGGPAAKFIWNTENRLDEVLNAASDDTVSSGAHAFSQGWHGRNGVHTAMFLDGHADHRFFGVGGLRGPDWTALPILYPP